MLVVLVFPFLIRLVASTTSMLFGPLSGCVTSTLVNPQVQPASDISPFDNIVMAASRFKKLVKYLKDCLNYESF